MILVGGRGGGGRGESLDGGYGYRDESRISGNPFG
jgi:hypothetical protein